MKSFLDLFMALATNVDYSPWKHEQELIISIRWFMLKVVVCQSARWLSLCSTISTLTICNVLWAMGACSGDGNFQWRISRKSLDWLQPNLAWLMLFMRLNKRTNFMVIITGGFMHFSSVLSFLNIFLISSIGWTCWPILADEGSDNVV